MFDYATMATTLNIAGQQAELVSFAAAGIGFFIVVKLARWIKAAL